MSPHTTLPPLIALPLLSKRSLLKLRPIRLSQLNNNPQQLKMDKKSKPKESKELVKTGASGEVGAIIVRIISIEVRESMMGKENMMAKEKPTIRSQAISQRTKTSLVKMTLMRMKT